MNKKELKLSRFLKGRIYVFIDAANVFYSQQTLKWKVDYGKLKKYLEKELNVKKVFFYSGKVGANDKQAKFLYKLKKHGYTVKSKEVKKIQIGPNMFERKGNLDV